MSFPVPAQRRWPLVVTGLVAGLVLGAAAVGIPWALAGGGSSGTAADVASACETIARTPNPDVQDHYADLRRWGAAAELVAAAAEEDPSLKPLSDTLRAPVVRVQQTFDTDSPKYFAELAKARQACADATS